MAARLLLSIALTMKAVFRAILLWLILGGLSWLLLDATDAWMTHPVVAGALLLLPGISVWLTERTVEMNPRHWAVRLGFWVVTLAGWALLLMLLQGRAESHGPERPNILLTFGLIGLVAVGMMVRTRRIPSWRLAGEWAGAFAILSALVAAAFWAYDAKTHSIAARAEARWTEIGLPMSEFEKSLTPSRENAGSAILRQVLSEQVNAIYYRTGTRAAEREPVLTRSPEAEKRLKEAIEVISAIRPNSDDLVVSPQSVALLESSGAALDESYRRILAAEPASWACNPRDGFTMSVPNYMGIRQLSQIIAGDAMRRLAAGDQEGAARALAAGLRVREGLLENPTLVSLMMDVAIDALLSARQVRLPASADGFDSIDRDVRRLNAEFLRRLQMDAWTALYQRDLYNGSNDPSAFQTGPLPKWAARIYEPRWGFRQLAVAALHGAEHAAIQLSPATMSLPDLGESLHEAITDNPPCIFDPNVCRALKRMYATLLLREQMELIRNARARLAAGQPIESRDSVVLPGLRWDLNADPEKATVTTRLVGVPEWIATGEVTGKEFWLLPLDGSAAWQFRKAAQVTARD